MVLGHALPISKIKLRLNVDCYIAIGFIGCVEKARFRHGLLVDDLLARGYGNVTVLDISRTAIDVTKMRLAPSRIVSNGSQLTSLKQTSRPMPMTFGTIAQF